jgi:hypothetical protein
LLEEVLTWLGVGAAAALAWGLYLFGENQINQGSAKAEKSVSDE